MRYTVEMAAVRATPTSPRLGYRELSSGDVDIFHELAVDPHIRRFLFDGQVVPREWAAAAVETNRRQLEASGLGLWLLFDRAPATLRPIGFAGFWSFETLGPDLQLLYALRSEHTGNGLAREAAAALVDFARARAGLGDISAAVDEPNAASIRVLEKLGFVRIGEAPGAFDRTLRFRLPAGQPPWGLRAERIP